MSENLKILRWDVSGWAGIDHVSVVNPSPHLIEFFSADNAEGKSSLLESLRGALGGAGAIGEGAVSAGQTAEQVRQHINVLPVLMALRGSLEPLDVHRVGV